MGCHNIGVTLGATFRTKKGQTPSCSMACFTHPAPGVHEIRWPRRVFGLTLANPLSAFWASAGLGATPPFVSKNCPGGECLAHSPPGPGVAPNPRLRSRSRRGRLLRAADASRVPRGPNCRGRAAPAFNASDSSPRLAACCPRRIAAGRNPSVRRVLAAAGGLARTPSRYPATVVARPLPRSRSPAGSSGPPPRRSLAWATRTNGRPSPERTRRARSSDARLPFGAWCSRTPWRPCGSPAVSRRRLAAGKPSLW